MLSTWFLPDYAYLVQCPLGRSPTSPSSSKNILGMLALVFSSSSLPWSSTQGSWRLGLMELTKIEMCVCSTSKSQDLLCIILNCIHLVVSHLSSPWEEFYPCCMPEKKSIASSSSEHNLVSSLWEGHHSSPFLSCDDGQEEIQQTFCSGHLEVTKIDNTLVVAFVIFGS